MTECVPPIKDYVERTIRLSLGNPVMLLCEKEAQIKDEQAQAFEAFKG